MLERVVVVIAFIVAGGAGCERGASASGASVEAGAAALEPAAPVVTDDATSLLFSFVDEHGRVVAVPKAADVPDAVKARVLVVDLAKTPEERQAHRVAFFADLRTQDPSGHYPVTAVSRYDGSKGAAPAALPPPDGSVVLYSATWCGYCKKAKAWMAQQGVPVIERDVEKTPGAQAELSAKLRAAGTAGGGIPVIDWQGTLVVGFDKPALERLLVEKPVEKAAAGAADAAVDGPGPFTP